MLSYAIAAGAIACLGVVLMYFGLREQKLPLVLDDQQSTELPPMDGHERFGIVLIPKQFGGGDTDWYPSAMGKLELSWYRNYTFIPHGELDLQFMPLVAGYTGKRNVSEEYLDKLERHVRGHRQGYPDGTIWQVGNEIGYRPQGDARTREQYAEDFERCYRLLKACNPSFRMAVGAAILSKHKKFVLDKYVERKGGTHYIQRVLAAYKQRFGCPMPADFFTVSAYVFESRGTDIGTFKEQILDFRRMLATNGFAAAGLIVHEYGCVLKPPFCERPRPREIVDFMEESFDFMMSARDPEIGCAEDGGRLVQRWAWFGLHTGSLITKLRVIKMGAFGLDFSQTSLCTRRGEPTCLGRAHAAYVAALASHRRTNDRPEREGGGP